MRRMPRCRGLLGWLLGHKFTEIGFGILDHCLRCGMARDSPAPRPPENPDGQEAQ